MIEGDSDASDSFQEDGQILCIQGLTESIIPFTGTWWKIVTKIVSVKYLMSRQLSIKFSPIKILHYMVCWIYITALLKFSLLYISPLITSWKHYLIILLSRVVLQYNYSVLQSLLSVKMKLMKVRGRSLKLLLSTP